VRVKSGTARIDLVEGGQISICGPAHLSVLKSGGSLTIALDTGTIHVRIERELALTIYTPQIQAQTVAIGDGPRDALVGSTLPAPCASAESRRRPTGAAAHRAECPHPPAGDVLLLNGQLDSLRTNASTAPAIYKLQSDSSAATEVSQLATAEEARKKAPDAKPNTQPAIVDTPPAKEEPVYQVFVRR